MNQVKESQWKLSGKMIRESTRSVVAASYISILNYLRFVIFYIPTVVAGLALSIALGPAKCNRICCADRR